MEQNTSEDKTKTQKKNGCLALFQAFGCCSGCLILMLGFGGPAPLIPFFFPALFTSSGEHLPTAEQFSPEATNYSYYDTFMHRRREFDISEEAFLKMCKEKGYEPISIETLPDLPPFDHENNERPWVNYQREVPMSMVRYVYHKKEHRYNKEEPHTRCEPWSHPAKYAKCSVDPSGKTDNSCFHAVSKGYYYEIRYGNGGGLEMLYDLENGRCYMHWNHH